MMLHPMIAERLEEIELLRFPLFSTVNDFECVVTTRPWNMATHQGPETQQTVDRRRRICERINLPFERLTAADQIHSGHVWRIVEGDVGRGRDGRHTALKFVDGLICDLPRTPVMQFSADCPLIVAVDPGRRVFGICHASWRGIMARIAEELIRLMRREFGCRPAELLAGLAPCAGPGEYEVGEEILRIAEMRLTGAERFFDRRGGRLYLDMRAANAAQLAESGVQQITIADASTMADSRFFSHRRDGATAGRFALIAGFR